MKICLQNNSSNQKHRLGRCFCDFPEEVLALPAENHSLQSGERPQIFRRKFHVSRRPVRSAGILWDFGAEPYFRQIALRFWRPSRLKNPQIFESTIIRRYR